MADRVWTEEKPYTPFIGNIPTTRTEALSLLRRYNDKVSALSWEQQEAIRRLYNLDNERTIVDLIQAGEVMP